jgi:hypothetical protein
MKMFALVFLVIVSFTAHTHAGKNLLAKEIEILKSAIANCDYAKESIVNKAMLYGETKNVRIIELIQMDLENMKTQCSYAGVFAERTNSVELLRSND